MLKLDDLFVIENKENKQYYTYVYITVVMLVKHLLVLMLCLWLVFDDLIEISLITTISLLLKIQSKNYIFL